MDKFVEPILHLIVGDLPTDQYFKEHEEDVEVLLKDIIALVTWGPDVIMHLEDSKEIDHYRTIFDFAWSWSTM